MWRKLDHDIFHFGMIWGILFLAPKMRRLFFFLVFLHGSAGRILTCMTRNIP